MKDKTIDAARLSLLLNELRLPGAKVIWPQLAEQANKEGWPAARFLAALAEHELACIIHTGSDFGGGRCASGIIRNLLNSGPAETKTPGNNRLRQRSDSSETSSDTVIWLLTQIVALYYDSPRLELGISRMKRDSIEHHRALQEVARYLQTSQPGPAKAPLHRILQAIPDDPHAHQLLGVLARQSGEPAQAEANFRRSLKLQFNQPHVHNNLGNLLQSQGRLEEAIACYREAVRLKPDYVDAWVNLGITFAANEQYAAALEAYDRALTLAPTFHRASVAKAHLLTALDRSDAAEIMLRDALRSNPKDVTALNNLGNLLRAQGEETEAAACFEQALAIAPAMANLWTALGGVYFSLGRFDEAEALLTDLLAHDPNNLEAHRTLTALRHETNRTDQIVDNYEEALARSSGDADIWLAYVGTSWQLERYEKALSVLDRAIRNCGELPLFDMWRGRILVSMGAAADALAWLDPTTDGTEGLPGHQVALERARAHLRLGEFAKGANELTPIAFADHGDYALWAYLEVLWRSAGDDRASWLLDYDRFVRLMEVPVPKGFSSHREFNRALLERVTPLHVTTGAPIDQTERGGTKSHGELFKRRDPLIQSLRVAILEAIRAYMDDLPDEPEHPFLRYRGTPIRFAGSWSVRLFSEGYHVPHYHPEGWISSAYYVALPGPVADPAQAEGRLHFGVPPVDIPGGASPVKEIQPEIGTLALFPSYCWHGTHPFSAFEPRVTVAFDVARG